ncbi:MAG: hypothetical protein E7463_11170 [Ruminococcaceae bacterium]|nr:hypothetical protein [Oscillospiraceae bacterium]
MSNIYTMDWHIHTIASYDATLPYRELVKEARAGGITEFGVTEHVDHPFEVEHLQFSYKMFLANRVEGMHFGVELSPMSKFQQEYSAARKWEMYPLQLAGMHPVFVEGFGTHDPELVRLSREQSEPWVLNLTEEQIRENHVEYVIAAAHLVFDGSDDRESIIRHWHRQQMFCATDSRVDIVGHPWWGLWTPAIHFETLRTGKPTEKAWYQDFRVIPQSMHDEFAAAVLENGKCVEMNMSVLRSGNYSDTFRHQYVEYMRMLYEKGVPVTTGTDSHDAYENHQTLYAKYLSPAGFRAGDFSKPKFRVYDQIKQ